MNTFIIEFIKLFNEIATPLFYGYIFLYFIIFQNMFNKKTLFIYYKMYLKDSIKLVSIIKLCLKQVLFIVLLNGLFLIGLILTNYELSSQTIPFVIFFIIFYNLFIFVYHNINIFLYVCYKHRKDILNNMIHI